MDKIITPVRSIYISVCLLTVLAASSVHAADTNAAACETFRAKTVAEQKEIAAAIKTDPDLKALYSGCLNAGSGDLCAKAKQDFQTHKASLESSCSLVKVDPKNSVFGKFKVSL